MSNRKSLRLERKRKIKSEKKLEHKKFINCVISRKNEQIINSIPFRRLIDDCWEYTFNFLSICDILRLSQTCERMELLCGDYLNRCFPNIEYCFSLLMKHHHYLRTQLNLEKASMNIYQR